MAQKWGTEGLDRNKNLQAITPSAVLFLAYLRSDVRAFGFELVSKAFQDQSCEVVIGTAKIPCESSTTILVKAYGGKSVDADAFAGGRGRRVALPKVDT